MPKVIPEYIKPSKMEWKGIEPPSIHRKDLILGIYYNILCPQERDANTRQKFYLWFAALNPSLEFPLHDEEIHSCTPSTCLTIAEKAFAGQLAKELKKHLDYGRSFEQSLKDSLNYLEKNLSPILLDMGDLFQKKARKVKQPLLKSKYQILADSFINCSKDPKKFLSYPIQKYQQVKNDFLKLSLLLQGSIEKASGYNLRSFDYWEHRKKPLNQLILQTLHQYSQIPFFLALQEVTIKSLLDLTSGLADKNIHWISYNNNTLKKIEPFSLESIEEEDPSIHLVTIGLSHELQVLRTHIGSIPNRSGNPRVILGVEVMNQNTGGKFAIFSVHADHKIQGNLYDNTSQAIALFIKEFTDGGSLPFIFGGDLNAFEGMGGDKYLAGLQNQYPMTLAKDFREGDFYAPQEVKHATFLGHERDDYKMSFLDDGEVQPNALDHIFLTPDKLLGFRKAGVYDSEKKVIDPVNNPQKFRDNLKLRNTTSDHFMNGVLFISP